MHADLILHSGLITTLDRSNPQASAVAVKDGSFLAVVDVFVAATKAENAKNALTFLGGPDAGALSGAVVPTDHGLLAGVRVGAIASPFVDDPRRTA